MARNRNLVLVVVEQPLVIAAQRPVIDAFELCDSDDRSRCAVLAVVQRDGLAVIESDRTASVCRFGVVGDEFVLVQGVDDRLERVDLFLHRSDLLFEVFDLLADFGVVVLVVRTAPGHCCAAGSES